MIKTTLKIDGMMCSMCQAHINDAIRRTAAVKKATSSHSKGETVIISEQELDLDNISKVLSSLGYTVNQSESEQYEKRGLF